MQTRTSAAHHIPTSPHAGPQLDVHARNVRAVLIAGDQPGTPGLPVPGATGALELIEDDLYARFPAANIQIDRLRGRPTRLLVLRALESVIAGVQRGELLIVMFAGHGTPAHGPQRAQGWVLTEDDVFTDVDLADALRAVPAGVEIVVLSDCCFGEGMFHAGGFGRRLCVPSPANGPMVCVSAAGPAGLVELSKLATLARETIAAAAAGQSYRQLADTFAATAVAGCTFHVDARPAGRRDDLVLGTSHPRECNQAECTGLFDEP